MSNKKDTNSKKVNKAEAYLPNMIKLYKESVIPAMVSRFSYVNSMQVPKLLSISLNMGIGDAKTNSKKLESAISELGLIAGQKPVITKSKSDISNFKIRKGFPVGCKVTLRSFKMYEFLDRLVNIALPRIKDFRGLSEKGIDKSNNYSFGIKEHIVFPEVNFDKVDKIRGLDITIVTKSKSKEGTIELLREFNFPLNSKKN